MCDARIPDDPYHTRPEDLQEKKDPAPDQGAFTPGKRRRLSEVAGELIEGAVEIALEIVAEILD